MTSTLTSPAAPAPLSARHADPGSTADVRASFVAPLHRHDPGWRWITGLEPMARLPFERHVIDHLFEPVPKLTRAFVLWQHARAARRIAGADLAFLFSTGVGIGVTRWLGRTRRPRLVYVGFTQDGPWPEQRIARVGRALRRCDAVTVFTEAERRVLVPRYGLQEQRVPVIPIHTDETEGYHRYADDRPRPDRYVLSMGSPNRRFTPVASACRDLGIPLVIITRPGHALDSLDDLARLGAQIITDADRIAALTWLKHAETAVMAFDDPELPGGFTTLVHAMFLQTPFVVTDCLGMDEHVIDGQTGFVTSHDDGPALRQAIGRIWDDPDLAARFGAAALARAEQRHSLAAAARSFYELGMELVAQRHEGTKARRHEVV